MAKYQNIGSAILHTTLNSNIKTVRNLFSTNPLSMVWAFLNSTTFLFTISMQNGDDWCGFSALPSLLGCKNSSSMHSLFSFNYHLEAQRSMSLPSFHRWTSVATFRVWSYVKSVVQVYRSVTPVSCVNISLLFHLKFFFFLLSLSCIVFALSQPIAK